LQSKCQLAYSFFRQEFRLYLNIFGGFHRFLKGKTYNELQELGKETGFLRKIWVEDAIFMKQPGF